MAGRVGRCILVPGALFLLALGCWEELWGGGGDGSNDGRTELEGTWFGYMETDGGPTGNITVVFSGNSFNMQGADPSVGDSSGTFTLNTSAYPRQIDMYITSSSMPEYVGRTALGIYQIAGDTLTMAVGDPVYSPPRPTTFTAVGEVAVFYLTRQ